MSDSLVLRSMLFADVVGFSKLPDSVYPGFLQHFLADADAVLSDPQHPAQVRNTWGDAIFAVFQNPSHAARAALGLQQLVESTDWNLRMGLAPDTVKLRLRIGLHSGPVHEGWDPVTRSPSFVGRHTNIAARIEPIAQEGHVYVSGEFAAFATVTNPNGFQFDYVGQLALPKQAGVLPVFRLLPRTDKSG
jgi:class 3 adenylate cyclase